MQTMLLAAELAGAITGIAACVCLLVKPLRNRILGLNDVREGQRCLLRSDILKLFNSVIRFNEQVFRFLLCQNQGKL